MANRRLPVRKIKEVLRLKFESQLSEHEIAYRCQISRTTVRDYLRRASLAKLNWAEAAALNEVQIIERLFPGTSTACEDLADAAVTFDSLPGSRLALSFYPGLKP